MSSQRLSGILDKLCIAVILVDILGIVLESVDQFYQQAASFFWILEITVVVFFTMEFLLRLMIGRLSYLFSGFSFIDLISILPFYLAIALGQPLTAIGLFQLFRLIRILKVGRYFRQWEVFLFVFQRKKNELKIMLYVVGIFLVLASGLMYVFENPYQPEKFSSIPASMWWAIVTMTTVGYGDLIPITVAGKIIGSLTAFMGIIMVALPTAILGSGFVDQVFSDPNMPRKCPHCKKILRLERHEDTTWLMRLFSRFQ